MGMIVNCVAYTDGRPVEQVELSRIHEVLEQPDRFIWIGLHEPTEEMLRHAQRAFDLHDLAVEDALTAHQRPKIELYGESMFVVLRTAYIDPEHGHQICYGETHIFLGARYIVVVRHGASLPYVPVRKRIESTPQLLRKGPGFVLYALMDYIVDEYFPIVDLIEQRLQVLEDKIFGEQFDRQTTAEIYDLQREMLEVKRVVAPMIDICNRLMRFDLALVPEDTHLYFRDVYDHIIRINELVDTLRELLTTALEANFSLISIRQNEVMKSFAGWGAIIAVPTMMAGIYGMNFRFMPELEWSFGYPMMVAITVGACLALFYRFRRAGWL